MANKYLLIACTILAFVVVVKCVEYKPHRRIFLDHIHPCSDIPSNDAGKCSDCCDEAGFYSHKILFGKCKCQNELHFQHCKAAGNDEQECASCCTERGFKHNKVTPLGKCGCQGPKAFV